MEVTYKVGDFRKLVMESSNEFKAKIGDGVESENKKNNDKSYKDSEKRAKDFDGGLKEPEKPNNYEKTDGNRTTIDYNPENASKEYKERVHAQAKGYTSAAEEKNGIEKIGDFNDVAYKGIEKDGKRLHKETEDDKKKGLTGSKMPEGTFKKEDMYEGKNIKTVYFKKTQFMNESHMKTRIPDEFKIEGNVFKMKDKTGNTFLVEWSSNNATILDREDKKGLVESVNRMKQLFGYNSEDYFNGTDSSSRITENTDNFQTTLENARKIIK